MCATCGCSSEDARVTVLAGQHAYVHEHSDHHDDHRHTHDHGHVHDVTVEARPHTIALEQAVLAKNAHLAEHNRAWLAAHGVTAINVMSSPGAGKTTLLERTIAEAGLALSVIEGDQETTVDAERIRAAGARTVQVNTGAGCHLDAAMVQRALTALRPERGIVVIENVGNLVCPALFDLGERRKVVIISVTEGDDKPVKYPHMFAAADLVLVNKIDLLPYVDFDLDRLAGAAQSLRPGVEIVPLSAKSGENLPRWYGWLRDR